MPSGIYDKPYAKNEFNFEINTPVVGETTDLILNTFDDPVEIEIYGCDFRKTDGTATEVTLQIDIEQLSVAASGGVDAVINEDYLRANRDLDRGDVLIASVELLKDDETTPLVIDRTNYLNIFRCGGVAVKGVPSFNSTGQLFFKYNLKKNTSYLFRTTVIVGATGTSESFVFGVLRDM